MDAVSKVPLVVLAFILLPAARALAAPVIEADICVYGGTSGGVIAPVQAARQGKSVALAVFGTRIGGMTTGGLGATDVGGNGTAYIQGLSRDFYNRIAQRYSVAAPKFTFEPKVATRPSSMKCLPRSASCRGSDSDSPR